MTQYIESETVELKSKYAADSFVREVVSFLNAEGGVIYIGVQDDGTVIGVENVDDVLRNISDCITDQIEPRPSGEIANEVIYEDNLPILAVKVKKGNSPLYCIRKYGHSSKGCPIRIGTTCKEMSPEEIRSRFRSQIMNEDYMLLASARYAPLSFNMMKVWLTGRGFHINEKTFEKSFELKRDDGAYNLLAELLADQNMVPVIFVKFAGLNKASISHRSDYGGQSLAFGYQRMKERLIAENICKTDTSVRPRIDEYLYDMDCVNEALVNMLVHNDWTITEPLVAFYTNRVVFTSHGGLPQGITEEEFFNGVSRPRNSALMRFFLSLGIVEHTGHGIPMIVEKYGREAFDIHASYIDVTIPFNQDVLTSTPKGAAAVDSVNPIDSADPIDPIDPIDSIDSIDSIDLINPKSSVHLNDDEKKIIRKLLKNPKITYEQLAQELGVSRKTVSRKLASLVEKKQIERVGNNRTGFWKITR